MHDQAMARKIEACVALLRAVYKSSFSDEYEMDYAPRVRFTPRQRNILQS